MSRRGPGGRPFPVLATAGVLAGITIALSAMLGGDRAAGVAAVAIGGLFALVAVTRPWWRNRNRP